MITVEEAKRELMRHLPAWRAEVLQVDAAMGRTLAADAIAPDDHPRFDMSAVDGYAIGDATGPWKVEGSIAAGQVQGNPLGSGACVRIFTGGQVPDRTYAVVMQERTSIQENVVRIEGAAPVAGANIRRKGGSFRTGEILLQRGVRVDPAAVGLLASSGLSHVQVAVDPVVSIIRTGNEFIGPGADDRGRIHSSNDHMLLSALRSAGLSTAAGVLTTTDDRGAIRECMLRAVSKSDVVITTGGVSVGDHDLVRPVLEEMGAIIHFHGIRQKPGKPMLFATLNNVPVFALPGNPRAVLVCWYVHVLPFLRAMQGASDPWLRTDRLPLADPLVLKGGRAEFRAARIAGGKVHLLADEGSHMLTSMVGADALVHLPHDASEIPRDGLVDVHYLPRS